MARPRRRYYIGLARELGMTVSAMLDSMDSQELAEQMAYDLLRDETTRERLEREQERERSRQQTEQERAQALKRLLSRR